MGERKFIREDVCLLDVDAPAWRQLIEIRGGCRCHLSPPCSACTEPPSEDEMNRVGYTFRRMGQIELYQTSFEYYLADQAESDKPPT